MKIATMTIAVVGLSTSAWAQAWTPAQGEGAVTVQFQDAFIKYHQLPTVRLDRGHIRGETMLVDFTYGLTDRIAVSVALPYVASKYDGTRPHSTGLDNGSYHSTFQDFRFDIRYNITRKGFVVTPFAGTILPSHGYEYFAHSAVGRDVRELQVGTYWAKLLDPVLPGLFVQGRISYGFAQQIEDISHNRGNLDLEAGYFVTPELRVFALGAGQLTFGGVDLHGNSLVSLGPVLYPHHDQISRDNILNVGAGAGYELTPAFGVYGSVIRTVAGRNVHALQHSLTVGMTWSFARGSGGARANQSALATRRVGGHRHVLARCLCQKDK
jgi:hypothetical protein